MELEGTGIDPAALEKYIQERIYTLPGVRRHDPAFSILLTGSRATGTHGPNSDVDLDVVCPKDVYQRVIQESIKSGIIRGRGDLFILRDDDWATYFGPEWGRPHFCLVPLERLRQQLEQHEDVLLWIYSHARVLKDPGAQVKELMRHFGSYPRDVLTRKIKHRWLMAAYWEVECFPHHHGQHESQEDEFLAGAAAVVNAANELLRLCFLVEGKPFPYTEKLLPHARHTGLGREICPVLERSIALTVGAAQPELAAWARLDLAADMLMASDTSEDCRTLETACAKAMIAAGVDEEWVEADFANLEELLSGELGPLPS